MNIVSSIVGLAIMGAAAPPMLQMSIAPAEAQKRAQNLSLAESSAVIFSAANEGQPTLDLTLLPANCPTSKVVQTALRAYDVTCEGGTGRYFKKVTRSFRLAPLASSTAYTNPNRVFAFATPLNHSHVECLPTDKFGVVWQNAHLAAGHLGACIPHDAWSQARYDASNPDNWLYDLSDMGFGPHPDYWWSNYLRGTSTTWGNSLTNTLMNIYSLHAANYKLIVILWLVLDPPILAYILTIGKTRN